MAIQTTDMIAFIYINSRVLRPKGRECDLTSDEDLQCQEDEFIALQRLHEHDTIHSSNLEVAEVAEIDPELNQLGGENALWDSFNEPNFFWFVM